MASAPIPSSSLFGSKPPIGRSSAIFSSPSRFRVNSKTFRARRITCDYSCFEVKGVTYRPPGTEGDLLNEISFSLPENRYILPCEYLDRYKDPVFMVFR